MSDEQFFELIERLRFIESRLINVSNGDYMLIQELKVRVEAFFDRAATNIPNARLRKTLLKIKAFVLGRLEKTKASAEALLESSTFDEAVDDLLTHAKGNIRADTPRWLRWLLGDDLTNEIDSVGNWLKLNKGLFRDGIGALPPKAEAQ